jgi:hypothetical protein
MKESLPKTWTIDSFERPHQSNDHLRNIKDQRIFTFDSIVIEILPIMILYHESLQPTIYYKQDDRNNLRSCIIIVLVTSFTISYSYDLHLVVCV